MRSTTLIFAAEAQERREARAEQWALGECPFYGLQRELKRYGVRMALYPDPVKAIKIMDALEHHSVIQAAWLVKLWKLESAAHVIEDKIKEKEKRIANETRNHTRND